MKASYINCSPEEFGKLFSEIRTLKFGLWHMFYRNHPHSPTGCSECQKVQEVIDSMQVAIKPMEGKS